MVLGGEAGDLAECGGDALAVALLIVALVAEQRHGAGELAGQLLQERLLGSEIAIEIPEEPIMTAILAELVPDVARGA